MRQFASMLLLVALAVPATAQITFAPAVQYPGGSSATLNIVTGDFNGDGLNDIVAIKHAAAVSFLPNTGAGVLGSPVLSIGATSGTGGGNISLNGGDAGDMDGDGDLDLCVTQAEQGVAAQMNVLLNNGNGTFAPPSGSVPHPTVTSIKRVVVKDLNGDGAPDVAAATGFHSRINVFFNSGSGALLPGPQLVSYEVQSITIADFDGDGDNDIAAVENLSTNGNVKIHVNNGVGTFALGGTYPAGVHGGQGPKTIDSADLDGDGDQDITVGRESVGASAYVGVLLNNGNGTFGAVTDYPVSDTVLRVRTGDFDGDTLPEIVALAPTLLATVLPNLGGGSFGAGIPFPVGNPPRDVLTADMNGDGAPDIVAAVDADVSILLNTSPSIATVPFPGSGEDLFLLTGVNGAIPSTGTGAFIKPVAPMDAVTVLINSPQGAFNSAPFVLAAEPFPTGTPPGPFPGFPEIHMSLGGMRILIDTTGLVVPIVIGSTGVTLTASIPPALSGQSIMLQAAAVSNMAANGIFATSDGHEFVVQ